MKQKQKEADKRRIKGRIRGKKEQREPEKGKRKDRKGRRNKREKLQASGMAIDLTIERKIVTCCCHDNQALTIGFCDTAVMTRKIR